MIQTLGRYYVRYFNNTYRRTGTLWEGRFKSCVIDAEEYLLASYRYIELNPVRAGVVESPSDYAWSRYGANGLGTDTKLCTQHRLYRSLGDLVESRARAYRQLFIGHIESDRINQIRESCNKGLALGSGRFKEEIEMLCGRRRVTPKKYGPKPK